MGHKSKKSNRTATQTLDIAQVLETLLDKKLDDILPKLKKIDQVVDKISEIDQKIDKINKKQKMITKKVKSLEKLELYDILIHDRKNDLFRMKGLFDDNYGAHTGYDPRGRVAPGYSLSESPNDYIPSHPEDK